MCFQILQIFFEYSGRPGTGTIFKFIEKLFFVSFSWAIYLLFQHHESLNFLVSQSVSCRLSKGLVVDSPPHQCLVLFKSSFSQKLNDFNKNNFLHFGGASETKRTVGKNMVNSRNFMFMEDFDHHVFSGPTDIF